MKRYLYISWSFSRSILSHYGKLLGLDYERVPANSAVSQYVEALAKAWGEYNNPRSVCKKKKNSFSLSSAHAFGSMLYFLMDLYRAVIMFVVQAEERNMYDQHFLSVALRERYPFLNGYNTKGKRFNFSI